MVLHGTVIRRERMNERTGSVDELTTDSDNAFTATGQIAPAEDDTALEDYSLTGVCNG